MWDEADWNRMKEVCTKDTTNNTNLYFASNSSQPCINLFLLNNANFSHGNNSKLNSVVPDVIVINIFNLISKYIVRCVVAY